MHHFFVLGKKIHGADSTDKDDVAIVDSIVTPTSKPLGKRAAAMVESLDDLFVDGFDASTTKEAKLVRVKIEPKD